MFTVDVCRCTVAMLAQCAALTIGNGVRACIYIYLCLGFVRLVDFPFLSLRITLISPFSTQVWTLTRRSHDKRLCRPHFLGPGDVDVVNIYIYIYIHIKHTASAFKKSSRALLFSLC